MSLPSGWIVGVDCICQRNRNYPKRQDNRAKTWIPDLVPAIKGRKRGPCFGSHFRGVFKFSRIYTMLLSLRLQRMVTVWRFVDEWNLLAYHRVFCFVLGVSKSEE